MTEGRRRIRHTERVGLKELSCAVQAPFMDALLDRRSVAFGDLQRLRRSYIVGLTEAEVIVRLPILLLVDVQ